MRVPELCSYGILHKTFGQQYPPCGGPHRVRKIFAVYIPTHCGAISAPDPPVFLFHSRRPWISPLFDALARAGCSRRGSGKTSASGSPSLPSNTAVLQRVFRARYFWRGRNRMSAKQAAHRARCRRFHPFDGEIIPYIEFYVNHGFIYEIKRRRNTTPGGRRIGRYFWLMSDQAQITRPTITFSQSSRKSSRRL